MRRYLPSWAAHRAIPRLAGQSATMTRLAGASLLSSSRATWCRTVVRGIASTTRLQRRHEQPPPPGQAPLTDFKEMDVFRDVPAPATSVDVCTHDGFHLDSGIKILDGNGVLLVGGEAFIWRPWLARDGGAKRLVNDRGQWEVPAEAFGLLSVLWPRPDLLVLGLGRTMLPLSPETKRAISELGMRVEVLDTRNAASQFNMLATERGVDNVAAALIPIGWREGVGAA